MHPHSRFRTYTSRLKAIDRSRLGQTNRFCKKKKKKSKNTKKKKRNVACPIAKKDPRVTVVITRVRVPDVF